MCDKRNSGTAADHCDRAQPTGRNTAPLQQFFDGGQQPAQRWVDELVEFGAGDPDIGAVAGQLGGYHGGGVGGQPFLGSAALIAQPSQ
ncbi:hypothetical protein MYFR107205_30820 [Mycolicibacterium frederiksbergense]